MTTPVPELPTATVEPQSPTLVPTLAAPRPTPEDRGDPGRPRWRGEFPPDFANDPELGPLMAKQRQRQVSMRYAALLNRLALPPAQLAQLKNLLAEKQLSQLEAVALARRQGLNRDEARAVARQSEGEAEAAIQALLGPADFAQLQEFDRTYPQRATVNALAIQLGSTSAPLSSEQQERLITLLADHAAVDEPPELSNRVGFVTESRRGPFNRDMTAEQVEAFFANKEASDAAALEETASFLTPAQVQAVRELQQDETDRLRLAALRLERVRRARAAGGG